MAIDPSVFRQNTIDDGFIDDLSRAQELSPNPCQHPGSFGRISGVVAQAIGAIAADVYLAHGQNAYDPRTGAAIGHGIKHILEKHAGDLSRDGFWSVQQYVMDVLETFNEVYASEGKWILARKPDGALSKRCLLIVEFWPAAGHYRVTTGFMRRGHKAVRGTLVWSR